MKIAKLIVIISISFLISCSKGAKEPVLVVDKAGMFKKEQQDLITKKLLSIKERTTNEVVLYTAKSLDSRSIADYSLEVSRKLGIGEVGLNNGLLILIAPNEGEIQIQVSVGDEWIIPDSISFDIVATIVKYLKIKDYTNGVLHGIDLIDKRLSEYDWKVHDISLKDFDKVEVGQIVSFSYENKERKSFKYPLPTDKQFQPDFFMKLNIDENVVAKLYYTKHMSDVLSGFTSSGKIKVFARIRSKSPLQLNLLGTIKM